MLCRLVCATAENCCMRGAEGWPERCMRCRAAEKAAAAEEKKKNKKNLKVLSFGDDVEDDEEDLGPPRAMRSAHDATKDPRCGCHPTHAVPYPSGVLSSLAQMLHTTLCASHRPPAPFKIVWCAVATHVGLHESIRRRLL